MTLGFPPLVADKYTNAAEPKPKLSKIAMSAVNHDVFVAFNERCTKRTVQ